MRLGCLEQCRAKIAELTTKYFAALPPHKEYMSRFLNAMSDVCTQEFTDNSKIYFETPAEPGALPPVSTVSLAAPLEFMPVGYMNMINCPQPPK